MVEGNVPPPVLVPRRGEREYVLMKSRPRRAGKFVLACLAGEAVRALVAISAGDDRARVATVGWVLQRANLSE